MLTELGQQNNHLLRQLNVQLNLVVVSKITQVCELTTVLVGYVQIFLVLMTRIFTYNIQLVVVKYLKIDFKLYLVGVDSGMK